MKPLQTATSSPPGLVQAEKMFCQLRPRRQAFYQGLSRPTSTKLRQSTSGCSPANRPLTALVTSVGVSVQEFEIQSEAIVKGREKKNRQE